MRSKRPWKKFAVIERVEFNSGDVKFNTYSRTKPFKGRFSDELVEIVHHGMSVWKRGQFESLAEAEADLDAWWGEWWPTQEKSTRRA